MVSAEAVASETYHLSLVVSDFGDGSIMAFMASLAAAKLFVQTSMANDANVVNGECSGDVLPFDEIIVVTQNESVAALYGTLYPDVQFVARNWTEGSAWWDMCTAAVSHDWFMTVTSSFTVAEDFKLPVDIVGASIKPIAPYIEYDSPYCGRQCKSSIDAARGVEASFNRHYGQEYAVYHNDITAGFCAAARTNNFEPSVAGYYSYMLHVDMAENGQEDPPECEGVADEAICHLIANLDYCTRADVLGQPPLPPSSNQPQLACTWR